MFVYVETEIVNIVGKRGNLGTRFSTFFFRQNSEKYSKFGKNTLKVKVLKMRKSLKNFKKFRNTLSKIRKNTVRMNMKNLKKKHSRVGKIFQKSEKILERPKKIKNTKKVLTSFW